jgi:hypothetical protein
VNVVPGGDRGVGPVPMIGGGVEVQGRGRIAAAGAMTAVAEG